VADVASDCHVDHCEPHCSNAAHHSIADGYRATDWGLSRPTVPSVSNSPPAGAVGRCDSDLPVHLRPPTGHTTPLAQSCETHIPAAPLYSPSVPSPSLSLHPVCSITQLPSPPPVHLILFSRLSAEFWCSLLVPWLLSVPGRSLAHCRMPARRPSLSPGQAPFLFNKRQ